MSSLSDDYYPPVDNPRLEHQLAEIGFAENHAHLNAAGYITEFNWAGFLKLGLSDSALSDFVNDGNLDELGDHHSSAELNHYLRTIKYLRIILDSYVGKHKQQYEGLLSKVCDVARMRGILFDAAIDANCENLDDLDGNQALYNQINDADCNDDLQCLNVIRSERQFWIDCFAHLIKLPGGDDPEADQFRLCLNLYILCADHLKLSLIQNNRGNGFDHFTDAENVKSSFYWHSWKTEAYNFESVFEKYTVKPSAKKIELRIAPKKSILQYLDLIKALKSAHDHVSEYHDGSLRTPDFGLIVHFIKTDPDRNQPSGLIRAQSLSRIEAYASKLDTWQRQTEPLLGLMTSPSYETSARFVVGIDTANQERENPPELFAQTYRQFHEIKAKHNFHYTYHVGEAYYTIIDGLRHIHEVMTRLQFSAGDRLGHALALGTNVKDYYKLQRDLVVTTQQSLLDDIAWLYLMYASMPDDNQGTLAKLTAMFDEHKTWLESVVGMPVTLKDYLDAYRLRGTDYLYIVNSIYRIPRGSDPLHEVSNIPIADRHRIQSRLDPLKINVDDEAVVKAVFNPLAVQLYLNYLIDPECYRVGSLTITEQMTDEWLKMVEAAQVQLQKLVLAEGIFIESNPSSNKKIGFTNNYEDLPMMQLNRHGLSINGTLDLPLSVNTDDGAIFQTTLAYEYELIAHALITKDEKPETVYDYIAYLQKASLLQSFVRDEETGSSGSQYWT